MRSFVRSVICGTGDLAIRATDLPGYKSVHLCCRAGRAFRTTQVGELFQVADQGEIVLVTSLLTLTSQVLDRAARLRAAVSSLRLPDAIHLATAHSEGCDLVVTNDRRLKMVDELNVILLGEASS